MVMVCRHSQQQLFYGRLFIVRKLRFAFSSDPSQEAQAVRTAV